MLKHHLKALYTLILFLFILPGPVLAQEFTQNFRALNALYIEAGGNSDTYTMNYDRVVYKQRVFKAAVRIGVGTNLYFMEG